MPVPTVSMKTLLFPWPTIIRALYAPFWAKEHRSIARILIPLAVSVVVVWWITVPVHELLHAAGCALAGGSVTELTIQRAYGGALLAKVFPFVTAGGDYAGQLKEFDTGGNDVVYLTTVAFPYLLTVLFGISVLRVAARSGNALLHGLGMVQTAIPVASVGGDYYEMGSIVVTRIAGMGAGSEKAELIRGDDFFLVMERVREAAISHGPLLVWAGLIAGILFMAITYDLSILFSRIAGGKPLAKSSPRLLT
jgi:hypothetical protein